MQTRPCKLDHANLTASLPVPCKAQFHGHDDFYFYKLTYRPHATRLTQSSLSKASTPKPPISTAAFASLAVVIFFALKNG